ncbi:MAG: flagellar hook-associated protein FlgK [Candidatus Zixiibacteriota bacterium]|nr:MAG: flagellar hook-associated protein FlgK [candidate division Zixibacteria bacterium]
MPGLFQGLEIGKRALLSHQFSLQTIGHNIANVNTPGYSRQRVNVTTHSPELSTIGPLGTGIEVTDVRQIRDLFLGEQLREDNKLLGQWQYKSKVFSQIESLFNEPFDNSLGEQLNEFWSAWADLATGDQTARDALLSTSNELTNSFHQLANQLENLRTSIDKDLVNFTKEINRYTKEIASINSQIQSQEIGNAKSNDLRDIRDRLVDELSLLVDVNTIEKQNGAYIVYMGSMALVDGPDQMEVGIDIVKKSGAAKNTLIWSNTSQELLNTNGELKGLMDVRDEIIPEYLDDLHELASTLMNEVNNQHSQGYGLDGSTGINFFDDSFNDAFTIKINGELFANPSKIAASSSLDAYGQVNPGDLTNALAMHELGDKKLMVNNSASISDFYNNLVGKLGVESREAGSFENNYKLLVNQVEASKQAVEGVSLDEEMTNMIKAQHAYDAAARVITTMDQALDTVISGMGIVGR